MSKITIDIEVPDRIRGTELERKLVEKASKHALEQAVLELYQERAISTGTGAELLGMSLWEFIPWLGQRQVSIFPSTQEEIAEEMQNLERLNDQLAHERNSE